MRSGQGRRDLRAGVSLLETLLSLALMAVMAIALAAVLGLSGRAAQRLGAGNGTTDLLLARYALRGWIEDAPLTAAFAGSADDLRFEALIDEPPLSSAVLSVVSLERNAAGAVVAAVSASEDGEGGGETAKALTLSPAGGLRIDYFGRRTPSAAVGWHSDWPATGGLPDLVRISYDGPRGGLPPLTAIPGLAARQSAMSLSSPLPPS